MPSQCLALSLTDPTQSFCCFLGNGLVGQWNQCRSIEIIIQCRWLLGRFFPSPPLSYIENAWVLQTWVLNIERRRTVARWNCICTSVVLHLVRALPLDFRIPASHSAHKNVSSRFTRQHRSASQRPQRVSKASMARQQPGKQSGLSPVSPVGTAKLTQATRKMEKSRMKKNSSVGFVLRVFLVFKIFKSRDSDINRWGCIHQRPDLWARCDGKVFFSSENLLRWQPQTHGKDTGGETLRPSQNADCQNWRATKRTVPKSSSAAATDCYLAPVAQDPKGHKFRTAMTFIPSIPKAKETWKQFTPVYCDVFFFPLGPVDIFVVGLVASFLGFFVILRMSLQKRTLRPGLVLSYVCDSEHPRSIGSKST